MEISSWACKFLARFNPLARLAWVGRPKRTPDELNPGDYALVQLFPAWEIGPLDAPLTIHELWNLTMRPNKHGAPEMVRIDRGTLFNSTGGTTPDWDPLQYVPVYTANFPDYGLSNYGISHGSFRPLLERWARPLRERKLESAKAKGADLKRQVDDIARNATDRLWHEASKTGSTTPLTTREERVAAEASLKKERQPFEDYYSGEKVFKGGL